MVLLIVEAKAVSDAFTGIWDSSSHSGLPFPALTQGKVLNLTITSYAMFCQCLWETCHFLNKNGGGVNGSMGSVGRKRAGCSEELGNEERVEAVVMYKIAEK